MTIVVAYLMQKLSMSLNDAYDLVKKSKSDISPNFNFMGQLLDFEQALKHARTAGDSSTENGDGTGNGQPETGSYRGFFTTSPVMADLDRPAFPTA